MSGIGIRATFLVGMLLALAPRGYGQTLEAADSLAVFDVDGNRLGAVDGGSAGAVIVGVFLNVDGIIFRVDVEDNRISSDREEVFFESMNCSGEPLFLSRTGVLPSVMVMSSTTVNPGTVFIEDRSTPVQRLDPRSRLNHRGSCESVHFRADFHDALEFVDLFAGFTPPFSLREEASPGCGGPPGQGGGGPPGGGPPGP